MVAMAVQNHSLCPLHFLGLGGKVVPSPVLDNYPFLTPQKMQDHHLASLRGARYHVVALAPGIKQVLSSVAWWTSPIVCGQLLRLLLARGLQAARDALPPPTERAEDQVPAEPQGASDQVSAEPQGASGKMPVKSMSGFLAGLSAMTTLVTRAVVRRAHRRRQALRESRGSTSSSSSSSSCSSSGSTRSTRSARSARGSMALSGMRRTSDLPSESQSSWASLPTRQVSASVRGASVPEWPAAVEEAAEGGRPTMSPLEVQASPRRRLTWTVKLSAVTWTMSESVGAD